MKIPPVYNNKKLCTASDVEDWIPRCYWKKSRGTKSPRVLIKCGCCNKSFELFYDSIRDWGNYLELNGVMMSVNWLEGLIKFIKSRRR